MKPFFLEQHINIINTVTLQTFGVSELEMTSRITPQNKEQTQCLRKHSSLAD